MRPSGRRSAMAMTATTAMILFTAAGLLGCADAGEDATAERGAAPTATPVITVPVRMETERTRIEAVGTARALRSVDLYPQDAGEVVALNFSPGDRVTAGSVLLALDARDQELALELAEVRLAEAERNYQRFRAANSRGDRTVPQSDVDTSRSAAEAARIERDRAREAVEDRLVRAPFDGVVGLTDVDRGERIDTSTVITTLDDRSSLLVRFDVPEAFAGRLRAGDPIEIRTWTARATDAAGVVVDLGSRIDPMTRAFTARARVANPDDRLRPGMSFRINLDLAGATWPVVPEVAVMWGADGPYVWVVEEGMVRRVDLAIVQRGKGYVLVDGDLPPGSEVVAEGVQRMRSGLAVRALDSEALARDTRATLLGEPIGDGAGSGVSDRAVLSTGS